MKKINFIITVLLTFFSFSGFSQLKVASDGKVGIGIGTSTPNSTLSIGSAGNSNAELYVAGKTNGFIAKRFGNPGGSWITAGHCDAPAIIITLDCSQNLTRLALLEAGHGEY